MDVFHLFTSADLESLKKLQELKARQLEIMSKFGPKSVLGLIIGIATILLNSIPGTIKSTISDSLQQFDENVFYLTINVFIMLSAVSIWNWVQYYRAKNILSYGSYILNYTIIKSQHGLSSSSDYAGGNEEN